MRQSRVHVTKTTNQLFNPAKQSKIRSYAIAIPPSITLALESIYIRVLLHRHYTIFIISSLFSIFASLSASSKFTQLNVTGKIGITRGRP